MHDTDQTVFLIHDRYTQIMVLVEKLRQIVQRHGIGNENRGGDHNIFDEGGALGHEEIVHTEHALYPHAAVDDVGILNVVIPIFFASLDQIVDHIPDRSVHGIGEILFHHDAAGHVALILDQLTGVGRFGGFHMGQDGFGTLVIHLGDQVGLMVTGELIEDAGRRIGREIEDKIDGLGRR